MKKQVINNFEFIFRPNIRFYTTLVGLAILLFAFLAGFGIAKWLDQKKLDQYSTLQKRLEARDEQVYQLEQQLNFVRVEAEVGKLSLQQIQQDLQTAQQNNIRYKEQLSFYQNIMAPELNAGGVTIDRLYIEPTLIAQQYRYKVVLIQTSKIKQFAKGNVTINLKGMQNEQASNFEISQLALSENDMSFNFKYFQILEGNFVLPENFTPERIELTVTLPKARGQEHSETSQVFDWQPEITHQE
ncbi:hypothetical protein N7931_10405 [Catenovulum sp. 2E275]|uniref:DUF6776 family protein n=1 Tax=Catenovulum sp. 2E275 TaxID=2980497 RepID=UPI0021D2710E|nr:DUF6776 family protein [Catenovulum sp. 2E275]MCU4676045.1 hypothetical protein [Catenovulum sp. 2E275]